MIVTHYTSVMIEVGDVWTRVYRGEYASGAERCHSRAKNLSTKYPNNLIRVVEHNRSNSDTSWYLGGVNHGVEIPEVPTQELINLYRLYTPTINAEMAMFYVEQGQKEKIMPQWKHLGTMTPLAIEEYYRKSKGSKFDYYYKIGDESPVYFHGDLKRSEQDVSSETIEAIFTNRELEIERLTQQIASPEVVREMIYIRDDVYGEATTDSLWEHLNGIANELDMLDQKHWGEFIYVIEAIRRGKE